MRSEGISVSSVHPSPARPRTCLARTSPRPLPCLCFPTFVFPSQSPILMVGQATTYLMIRDNVVNWYGLFLLFSSILLFNSKS